MEMLKKRLQRIYDLALASDTEKHYFLWLHDYVRVFDTEGELKGFFDLVGENREADFKRIHELESIATKEIDVAYKKVAKYVKDKKIDHKVITKELGEYAMATKGQYSSSRGHLEDLYDKLSYALMTMVEDGTVDDLKFAQGFGVVSDERRITEWTFSPSYTEYDMLKDGIKKIQETRLWYCWDKVTLAFRIVDDYKHEVVKELLETKRHFEAVNWSGLYSEMMAIIEGKRSPNEHSYEFISKDYRYYLAKVHLFAEEYLQSNPTPSNFSYGTKSQAIVIPLEVKWKLVRDENYLILVINGKEIRYSSTDDGGILIAEIDDNMGSVFNDEVYEKLSGEVPGSKDKKTVKRKAYDVARVINGRILKETLVAEFIVNGFEKVGFNPVYKRI